MNANLCTLRVKLVQISAGADPAANLSRLEALLGAPEPTDFIALPEVFAVRCADADYRRHAEPVGGPLTRFLAALARRHGAYVLAGSIIERAAEGCFNTALLLDREGRVTATYRKMHLFEAEIETGRIIRESSAYQAGTQPVMADIDAWRCGLSICYDLRFPELFRHYSARGAHLLLAPSNFTQRTGTDHWQVLVKARAIENQCFVVAPDQCGANPVTGIVSHGHSLAVSPWGDVLGEAQDAEGVLSVALDPQLLHQIRARVPALKHRRL